MRKNAFIGIFILLIMNMIVSCSPKKHAFSEKQTPHHFSELKHAGNLLQHHREQALSYLDSLLFAQIPQNWNEIEQHEFHVLLVEAQYKNGVLQDSSPDLHSAVAFFDSLSLVFPDDETLRFVQANAHYYLGTNDRFQHKDVEAASDFVKALLLMRDGFSEATDPQKTRFVGLAYFRLGEILNSYNIQSSAISVFDSARVYFEKVHDTLGVAASIRNVGEVYLSNKDYEKALAKFKEANKLWDFGDVLYDPVIGGVFFTHHQYDSARFYLERSFLSSGPYARIDAAAKLAEIYHVTGDLEKENYYTSFYVQNSIREANRSSDKMEIEFIADSVKSVPLVNTENFWQTKAFVLLILSILAVIAILAFIIIRNRRRISHIEKHLSTMEQLHREETMDKELQIEAISQQLNDTQQQLEREKQKPKVDMDKAINAYLNAPITVKIRNAVEGKDIMTKSVGLYPRLKLSEVEFIEVVSTANQCFPNFSITLLRDYHALSTADVRHCCLALMGLNDAEMAVMEGITYSGANRKTNRILSIMNAESGLEECILVYIKNNLIS